MRLLGCRNKTYAFIAGQVNGEAMINAEKKLKGVTYRKSGVNIAKADEFVKGMKGIFGQSKSDKVSAFGSLFNFKPFVKKYKEPVLASSTDGVGTKLMLAQKLNIHDTVGIDLVAMNVNDIVCLGAQPLFFLDYIACGKVKPRVLWKVTEGISKGLTQSGCLLLGGETAEMPDMYEADEYDLAGFCVGVVDKQNIINGKRIKTGDLVVGLESSGLHSNGFSLVRKVFTPKEIKKYGRELIEPTRIYVNPVLSLLSEVGHGSSIVKGIAHITGGAFYSKATKILPSGIGMVIYKERWPIPNVFKLVQEKGGVSCKEMYTVFNMGIGMILVVDKRYAKKIAASLNKKCKSYIIGEVVKSNKSMCLV